MTDDIEFHDLSELALNQDGQSWGNLGYWQDADDNYSEACRALALQLGNTAQLDQQSIVFDAGFGCGDQLKCWLEHFHVTDICGANLSKSQTLMAQKLLADNDQTGLTRSILQGDIDKQPTWFQAIGNREITHILALDCAYHFPNRTRFLQNANAHLPAGGKIVLTDFILADQHDRKSLKHQFLRIMLKLSRIPTPNIVNQTEYRVELEGSGFPNAMIEDISQPVMLGFANWYGEIPTTMRAKLSFRARVKYRITALFLKWAYRHFILRYCLISAQKRSD